MGGKSDTIQLLKTVGFVKCGGCSKSKSLLEGLDWYFQKPRGKFLFIWPRMTSYDRIGQILVWKLKKASDEAHDLYHKHRANIENEQTAGRMICSFAHNCQFNVVVTKDFALFGNDFEHIMALYPISKSKKLMLVVHLSEVGPQHKHSRFQIWKLSNIDQKVNFDSYHMSHFLWLIS